MRKGSFAMKNTVAVIGGGAAGMMAAIWAARSGAEVTILEKNDRIGKKILATGNGKCNFANRQIAQTCYYGSGSERVMKLIQQFGVEDSCAFFEGLGMRIKDRNGYLYPASEQASTVLDMLRLELERLRVRICTQQRVTGIKRKVNLIIVETSVKDRKKYDCVILTCGGMAAPKTGSDGDGFRLARGLGHTLSTPVPGLTGLKCEGDFWKSVAGVRAEACIQIESNGEKIAFSSGELQITDYGISGIPTFQISREAAYALRRREKVTARINFMSSYRDSEYDDFWKERWDRQSGQSMEEFTTGILNKKLNLLFLRLSGISQIQKAAEIPDRQRRKLEKLYHNFEVHIKDTNSFEQAQVTAGGIVFSQVDETLQSVLVPGVYFAGELMDIDGLCGGYNLQWAFTSGKIAGCAAAKRGIGK